MKKIFTIITSLLFILNTQAQWTSFPGTATAISCGASTELGCVFSGIVGTGYTSSAFKYNFTINDWTLMSTAPSGNAYTSIGVGNDGAMWLRSNGFFTATCNLLKFGLPAVSGATTQINGVLDNISVLSNSSAIGTVGSTNNNIYQTTSTANTFSLFPGSSTFAGKKVVLAGSGDAMALNQAASGNNIFRFIANAWVAVPSTTVINATDIAVGQNTNQMIALSGGNLYYYNTTTGNWVQDATAPANITKITMATDASGKIYVLTNASTNNIRTNNFASIGCGVSNNTAASALDICPNTSTTLSVLGNNITWYTQATGGVSLGSGNTFATPVLNSNTTYYAQSGTCLIRTVIPVISSAPSVPTNNTTAANLVRCEGTTTTLSVVAVAGQTVRWYTQLTGGSYYGTNNTFSTPLLFSTTTYYVEAVGSNGCISATRTPITITVIPTLQNTTPSANQTICVGNSTTLTTSGTNVTWYNMSSGGNSIGTGNTFNTPVLNSAGNVIYYAQDGSCTPRLTVAVSVLFIQSAGTLTGNQEICLPGTTTFSTTSGGGTWSSSNTAIATVNPTTGVITGISAGTATISYTVPGTIPCANGVGTRTVTVATNSAGVISLPDTICISGNGSIFATSSIAGGSWSSSNTSILQINQASGFLAPILAGTVTVTYTSAQGICGSSSTSKTLVIRAIPNAGTLSGVQTICLPGTSTFSTTGTGGTWSSSANAIATVNATTGVVTGVAAGTATITYTVQGGSGCGAATVTRTVQVYSAVSAGTLSGTQTVCTGSTRTFTSTVSGGTWSSSNNSIATVNSNGVVSGLTAGTATITYTVAGVGTCAGASATRTITVNAAPNAGTLSGVQAICLPGTSTFSTTGSGGTWSSSSNAIATVNANGVVTGVSAGTATIRYIVTGTAPCTNDTATRTITITNGTPTPIIYGFNSVCQSNPYLFSASASGGTWSSSNNNILTIDQNGELTMLTGGNVDVIYTLPATGNCAAVSATYAVAITAAPNAGTLSGVQAICLPGTTAFSTTGAGGTWSSSNNNIATVNANGVVTGVAAGTAIITYTVIGTAPCSNASASRTIEVFSTITAGTLSGSQTVCTGSTVIFGSTISGGTWSSSNNNIATVNANGVVSGLTVGTATITYTVAGVGTCAGASATRTITVNAATPTIVINQTICEGYAFFYDGQAYTMAGTYNFIKTNSVGCDSTTILNITVLPSSSSNSSKQLCLGESFNFFGQNITTAGSYSATILSASGCDSTINISVSFVSEITTNSSLPLCAGSTYVFGSQTISSAGVYTETFVSSGGCDSTATITVFISNLPTGLVVTQNGATLTVNDDYDSYEWYNAANAATVLGTNATFTASVNGSYFVKVYNEDGCSTSSDMYSVVTIGIRNIDALNLKIFPNPTNGLVNIENLPINSEVKIQTLTGQTIFEAKATQSNQVFDLSNVANGLYFVNVYQDGALLGVSRLAISK